MANKMTNKRLIRYCNIYWEMGKTCAGCKYFMNYCEEFQRKTGLATPYMENKFNPEVYTDEELEGQDEV